MSGHSKWSSIKRQKGTADIKKGQIFTKLANAITIAVKQGGAVVDPASNFKLRLLIDKAQAANMPKENIERAIARATGLREGDMEEVIYEGFAPCGVSVMIEAVTDNHQRTTAEVKNIFNKSGGNFGQPGSVSYQFKQVGRIVVQKGDKSLDEIFLLAADNGAEDVLESDDEVSVMTPIDKLFSVKNKLAEAGCIILDASLVREPTVVVEVSDSEKLEKVYDFVSQLEALDDVHKVYSNLAHEN